MTKVSQVTLLCDTINISIRNPGRVNAEHLGELLYLVRDKPNDHSQALYSMLPPAKYLFALFCIEVYRELQAEHAKVDDEVTSEFLLDIATRIAEIAMILDILIHNRMEQPWAP
jgi:hypothetical protein